MSLKSIHHKLSSSHAPQLYKNKSSYFSLFQSFSFHIDIYFPSEDIYHIFHNALLHACTTSHSTLKLSFPIVLVHHSNLIANFHTQYCDMNNAYVCFFQSPDFFLFSDATVTHKNYLFFCSALHAPTSKSIISSTFYSALAPMAWSS